ncbi:IclR family transcriptional regulator [Photobacterium lutimaris]|uniref:Transcriptional regulator n=1 Tax=Photobacterium lutimaris TaxID=388278 RepID=A0A2T3IZ05_9GAMM|nr:IclR family transcriptional regulator [Photobacterium lutimaris]PSU33905.1 transcriptional regulator [Photobacterium lutimaris]TDR76230.1 IclR family transcriptional regulator [Photobacterium lutimaris]
MWEQYSTKWNVEHGHIFKNCSTLYLPHQKLGVSMSSKQGNQALNKAISVIDAIADGHRQLKDICELLDLPKSTVHRILQGLIEARYIREVKGIGLVLGTKMIQLGIRAQQDMPLKEIAKPFLRALAEETQDTVHLGIKDEDEIFYLDKIPGERAIQLRSQVGDRLPMAATGIGKALMVDMPKTEWQRLIKKQQGVDLEAMLIRMAEYSKKDYSFDLEDNEDLVRCVAVPIRNKYNNIIAAISITSIKEYMPDERMQALIPLMKSYSQKISEQIN